MIGSKDVFEMMRSKMSFEDLMRKLEFAEDFLVGLYDQDKDLQEEQFEVTKGNFKTTIIYKFNKKGYPVSHFHRTESINSDNLEDLNNQQEAAIKAKDFKLASDLQIRIEKLQNNKTN